MKFQYRTPKYEQVLHCFLFMFAAVAFLPPGCLAFHSHLWNAKPPSGEASKIGPKSYSRTAELYTQESTQSSAIKIQSKPQFVQFREPTTNMNVLIIGTMHYNPTSINMVQTTIESLAQSNNLASVIIESCDVRYNATQELLSSPRASVLEKVLTSEMSVAKDVAFQYGVPCILGDQRINITGVSLKETFQSTFEDLRTFEGWKKLKSQFQEAAEVAVPVTGSREEGYLNVGSILDPRLVLAAPVSFIKYPLSFLARNPISTLVVFAFLTALAVLEDASAHSMIVDTGALYEYGIQNENMHDQILESLASLTFSVAEFGLFGRLMVQVLLKERNEVLAKNILTQCRIYSAGSSGISTTERKPFDIATFFFGSNTLKRDDISSHLECDVIYVPGSNKPNNIVDEKEKIVVAVLGMAHCNGIVKLLREERLVVQE